MSNEIINRVSKSPLITFDLENLLPQETRTEVDISQWLNQGFILREKEFRATLKKHDWSVYKDQYIALFCSTEAILPAWASLLITTKLCQLAKRIVWGSLTMLDNQLLLEAIKNLDLAPFVDKPVIVKGCSEREIPEDAYIQLIQKLQPVVKSLFYGEACSSVPLYKR